VLGPPKSQAGRRIVGIPAAIVPDLESHLAKYVKTDPGALVFPGIMGGRIRRGNFNKLAAWPHAVEALGTPGLHARDLRHTGNQFAVNSGAGLRDLMARMGHDSERAAMIYQHEACGADKAITDAIDKHVDDEQRQDDDGDDGTAGGARARLMARRPVRAIDRRKARLRKQLPTWPFAWERMTGIEPALSAWEADVLPLNYIRRLCRAPPEAGSSAVLAHTCYRNR
jgi:hypothetical protein